MKGFPIDNYAVSYVGKYYVWTDQWPSKYKVPRYCNGQCVGMSGQSARAIYKSASVTDPNNFRLEDMLFTGKVIFESRSIKVILRDNEKEGKNR